MILVVGGQGSGKRDYVRSLGFDDADMSGSPHDGPVLVDLHLLLRDGDFLSDAVFDALLEKQVVVCNEVGCGVVPMAAEERAWRDRVGRTCARLAVKASRVVRMCCGIPQFLKDEPV